MNNFAALSQHFPQFVLDDSVAARYAITDLPMHTFDTLQKTAAKSATLHKQLGSQGFSVSEDGSCAYCHDSTYDSEYHIGDDLTEFVNADRGCFFTKTDGTNGAVICDGINKEGCFSAFVAQLVANAALKEFSSATSKFHTLHDSIDKEAASFFNGISTSLSRAWEKDLFRGWPYKGLGSTTAAVVNCVALDSSKLLAQVAVLGDCSVLHLRTSKRKAQLFGGELVSSVAYPGCSLSSSARESYTDDLFTCIKEVQENDILILATHGLTKNVREEEFCEIITLVAFSSIFDYPLETLLRLDRSWERKCVQLPSLTELQTFIKSIPDIKEGFINPESVVRRLNAYIKIVTAYRRSLCDSKYHQSSHDPKLDDCMIIALNPS